MSEPDFRTKVIAIAKQLQPEAPNKEESITEISGEKKSTIRNWLYSQKKPPMGKRLTIADKFGVDVAYLFEDAPFNLPITRYEPEHNYYLVPQLTLSQVYCLDKVTPMPIQGRTVISLRPELTVNIEQVEKTYCVIGSGIDYEPFISASDTIFFNGTAKIIRGNFYILVSRNIQIVRMEQDGRLISNQGDQIKPMQTDKILPIIITMSSSYVTHAQ